MFIRIGSIRINLDNVSSFVKWKSPVEYTSDKVKYYVSIQCTGDNKSIKYECDSKEHMNKVLDNMDRCVSLGRSEKAKELYYVDKRQ